MPIVWYSKRSGKRGCFGCIPIPVGCGVLAALLLAVLIALAV